ncbi:MAG TPA: YdcF family protein [Anaerolineaceae bacterium]|nr:YdcF family protein [Anaerolineaceae bacterium]
MMVVLVILSPLLLRGLGQLLVYADPLEQADMAVALSGDTGDRVSEAAILMRNGYVEGIIITYTNEAARDALFNAAVKKEISGGRIYTTYSTVSNTVEEAKAVRGLTDERTWDSLIIITDPFHALRTRIIFRDIFQGTGVSIQVRTVPDHWYRANTWWKTSEGVSLTVQEYLKIFLYYFGRY